jgi:hypothetical protein
MPSAEYSERTRRNAVEANGTLIIAKGELRGGTRETLEFCREEAKPHLVIDTEIVSMEEAVPLIQKFIASNRIDVLNVAGPRASQWPNGYKVTRQIVSAILRGFSGHEGADE